jgi:hypothetical protein
MAVTLPHQPNSLPNNAHLHLNPAWVGMVEVPKDYRWRGYAAPVAGEAVAREGMSWVELLRCKLRHFSDDAVIGSKQFVSEIFVVNREGFGSRGSIAFSSLTIY